ncbi:carbon storage regulator [Bacillus sp. RO3]|nr:carbon storage regulator [Bacillus sp. RO3]
MLVLGRKLNESVVIDGRIVIKIVQSDDRKLRLAIEAPRDVSIVRGEVFEK